MRFPIIPRTYADLVQRANPASANQPEATPWAIYDTKTFTDNSTTSLTFFVSAQSDRSLSNLELGGQLPDPQFFELQGICLDIIDDTPNSYVTTAAGGATGALNDLGSILLSGLGRFTFKLSDKNYGPFPLSMLHGTGGPSGGIMGTFTAEESLQWANNAIYDGGFFVGGALIIPPKVGFSLVMEWPAALDLTGDYELRTTLLGVMHRAIR